MDLYLIQLKKRCLLYAEREQVPFEGTGRSQNHIDRLIQKLAERQVWWGNFLGRLIGAVRDVYYRLENRIDPMEQVFKRMRHGKQLTVHVSSSLPHSEALAKLKSLLGTQRKRHAVWIVFDALLALGALVLTPFLVPIPGPNLFLYYPGLRAFSHYLAYKGATHGLSLNAPRLVGLATIADLENLLSQQTSSLDAERIRDLAKRLGLEEFPAFVVRYL